MKDNANKTLKKGKAFRFAHDKEYRERIMRKYKKICEKKYHKEIRALQRELNRLIDERDTTLKKIRKRRWVDIGFVSINETEGLIKIEDKVYYFTEVDYAKRIEDYEDHSRMNSYNTYTTKRHPSALGAGVGGIIGAKKGGLVGGIAGAAIGSKVFSKKETVVTQHEYMEYSYKYNYLVDCDVGARAAVRHGMQQAVSVMSLTDRGITNHIAVACRCGDVVPCRGVRLPCQAAVVGDVVPAVTAVADAHEDATVFQLGDLSLVAANRGATRDLPGETVVVGVHRVVIQRLRRSFSDGGDEHDTPGGGTQSVARAEERCTPRLMFRDDAVVAEDEIGDVFGLSPRLAVIVTV